MSEPVLICSGLTRCFGALPAVDDLSFAVARGEVFGIAGPNGAGKTTLFNLISGHVAVDGGRVEFDGVDVTGEPPHRRFRAGLARTFQLPQVFGSCTVMENALVGAHFGGARRAVSWRFRADAMQQAEDAIAMVGLSHKRDAGAQGLSVFESKQLMIASAIAAGPAVLLLDEPFGGLTTPEMDALARLIRSLNESGLTIVLIEHVLRALFSLSDRVMIVHHGQQIFLGAPEDALRDQSVISSYLGERAGAALLEDQATRPATA